MTYDLLSAAVGLTCFWFAFWLGVQHQKRKNTAYVHATMDKLTALVASRREEVNDGPVDSDRD